MEQKTADAVSDIAAKDIWTTEDHRELLNRLLDVKKPADKFKAILAQMESADPEPKGAAALKIGIARYILCRFEDALAVLGSATDNKDRWYFQAQCSKQLRRYGDAIEALDRAESHGWDKDVIALGTAEVRALAGELEAADKSLRKLERRVGQTAQYAYVQGLVRELSGDGDGAVEAYERAIGIDADHSDALFRLAYFYDLHGDEEEALALYERCVSRPPVHANALLNMAVLHEDAGRYDMAAACLRRILSTNRTHPRARLFLRDAESSKSMYYDEDQAKRIARRNAVLDIPVTDFELSVRARNCLKKMNIRSLGDLVRTTEPDLLAYKNFGETSLKEIKDMLTSKNLRLGQALEDDDEELSLIALPTPRVENEGVLATPLEQIEFSVRARRALQNLGVGTLGDLAAKTEAELLACKNFGQTSLNEVRQRLMEYGLALREPD